MKEKLQYLWSKNREGIFGYAIMVVVVYLYISSQKNFFSAYGIKSTFDQFLTLLFAALAQTIVILTGGINLSVGALIGLTNTLTAFAMVPIATAIGNDTLGMVVTLLLVLLVGAVAGWVNGMIIVKGRFQPIIVTLATSFIFMGIGMYLLSAPGGEVVKGFSKLLTGTLPFAKIPKSVLWLLFSIIIVWIPLRRSRLGQSIYAVGGNEHAAYVSGINVEKTKIFTYTLAGIFCAIAGILLTAQTGVGDPTGSEGFTMNSVAAVVLGGTALSGGRGSFIGTIAGVITYSLILGLLIFWSVPSFYQDMIKGFILIAALAINALQKIQVKRKERTMSI